MSQLRTSDSVLPDFVLRPCPDVYRWGTYVVLDWETTNKDFGSSRNLANRIVAGHWYVSSTDSYRSLEDDGLDALFNDLDGADFVVAHHAKFEIGWLKRLGYTTPKVWYDTYIGEYVWAGNRKVDLSLDAVALKYTGKQKEGEVKQLLDDGVCPSTIDPVKLNAYCRNDVEITKETFEKQLEVLHDLGLLPVLYTRCLLTPVLSELESRGLCLDRDKVKEEFTRYNEELNALKGKLNEYTGGINLNSPKQLAGYLYDTLKFAELTNRDGSPDRTDAGGRRTDADTVSRLKATSEKQRGFVELFASYGSLKVNTKTLEKMWQCCQDTPPDQEPLLFANYNQCVTQTHRLSSNGDAYKLQFQNVNTDFKPLFKAREQGWSVGEGDGAQLEFRVAVHLGRDPVGQADIRDPKFDAHYQTAEVILKKARSEITKSERSGVKTYTFKPLYGGMSGTADQRKYYKWFQKRYRGVYETQSGWTYEVARTKQLRTETGLIFYWPDCKISESGYVEYTTSIFNYPVQSLATADIIPIGVVCAYYRMLSLGLSSFLVNTIHDSIIAELAQGEEDVFRRVVETALTSDTFAYLDSCYGIRFSVPLGCESKVGTHWGTGTEEKYNLDPRELYPEWEV